MQIAMECIHIYIVTQKNNGSARAETSEGGTPLRFIGSAFREFSSLHGGGTEALSDQEGQDHFMSQSGAAAHSVEVWLRGDFSEEK